MTMITPSYLGETIEYSSLHACRSTLEDPTLTDRSLLTGTLEDVPFPDSLHSLIAARLDTLSSTRKSILQDASVVGKVFWAGALVHMGHRELRDVEQALHDLARKELVRPARTSSMHGEREYGFWHVLVRDVCYAQIPRLARVARHIAAAVWIETQAGDRVDDLADVLAHHYTRALELTRASGGDQDIPALEDAARHYLGLAGERALAIDVNSAEASFARALAVTPASHPDRASLLERWAQAARQQVRLTEASVALEDAASIYRMSHMPVAAARALTALASVYAAAGHHQQEQAASTESLALLQKAAPGPELVDAYAQRAGAYARAAAFVEAAEAGEAALRLAVELGLPEPAHALGHVGAARAYLGQKEGLDDMRRALALAIDQGRARDAAILHNNLALVTWEYEGPAAALDLCGEGIAFCRHRGIAEVAAFIEAMRLTLLAANGRADEALADASSVAQLAEAASDAPTLIEARSVQLSLLGDRGGQPELGAAIKLAAAARVTGQPAMLAMAVAAATNVMLAAGETTQAIMLLEELDGTGGTRDDPYYAAQLPDLVRYSLAVGASELADRLVTGVEPRTPLQRNALAASRAAIKEVANDRAGAAAAYAEAAMRWREFGDIPELAYALLGRGRCLRFLGACDAQTYLSEASELFGSMGYRPAMAETAMLLSDRPKGEDPGKGGQPTAL